MSGVNPRYRNQIESSSISKGGFCWVKEDLSHALEAMKNKDETKDETKGKDSSRLVLRSLLSNPGVGLVRPTRKRKRSHSNNDENNISLLPHVIELYYKRDTNIDRSFSDQATGMKELLDDVHKIVNEKKKFSLRFCDRYKQDLNFDFVQRSSNKNFASDEEVIFSNDAQCNRNFLDHAKESIFSDDALFCASDREIILHFLEPETFVKLSYASQLYDCYIDLYTLSKNDEKSSKKYSSFLKKLTKLAHIDIKIMEIFIMMLLEPLRRKTIVPLNENKYIYWLKTMMRQPNDIQPENIDGSYNVLRDAVVNCISSLTVNTEDLSIYGVAIPIIMIVSRLSFPVAKASLKSMIKGSVHALASMASIITEKLSNDSNIHKTVGNDMYASLNFDSCIAKMKRLVETDSRMKSLFLLLVSSNTEALEFGEVKNHVKDEEWRWSLIKIKLAVLQ